MKKAVLLLCGMALGAAVSAGGASALAQPDGVGIASCIFGTGSATVPAGTDVKLHFADIELNRGIAEVATKNWTFALANINGVPIANPSSYWNTPTPGTDFLNNGVLYPNVWAAWWNYDTEVTLGVGDTMTVDIDLMVNHPQPDSFNHGAPARGPYPQIVMDGRCTITGA
jgi:hypothetical protein